MNSNEKLAGYIFYKLLSDLRLHADLQDVEIKKEDLSIAFTMTPDEAKDLAISLLGGFKELEGLPTEVQHFFTVYFLYYMVKANNIVKASQLLHNTYAHILPQAFNQNQQEQLQQKLTNLLPSAKIHNLNESDRKALEAELETFAYSLAGAILKKMIPVSGDMEDWTISGGCRYHDYNGMILWEDFFWTLMLEDLVWMLDVLMDFGVDLHTVFAKRVLVPYSCKYRRPVMLKALLERGLQLDHPLYEKIALDAVGWTASDMEILHILLENGVNINVHHNEGTNWGKSPLQLALCVPHVEEAKFLLEAGGDVNALDDEGQNAPFQLVAGVWGATAETEEMIELMQMVLDRNPNLDVVGKDGNSVIYQCAANQLETYMKMLLEAGANIDPRKKSNQFTPLLFACKKGNVEALKLLLKFGAALNATDKHGLSGLHVAINGGVSKKGFKTKYREVIELLLAQGIDTNLTTSKTKKMKKKEVPEGTTALELAKILEVEEVIALLEN